jgi:hypothetical protein
MTDQDHRPVTHHVVENLCKIIGQLRDPAMLPVGSAGAAVRAQIIEDLPVAATEVPALEIPAIQVQGVAMNENQSGVAGIRAVHLIDLRVQNDTVGGDDLRPGGA